MVCKDCIKDIIFCDRCEKELQDNEMYETAEGEYICLSCHTSYLEE